MDRDLRSAVRHVIASGRSLDMFECLLEDADLRLIEEFEEVIRRARFAYHGKQILRAITLSAPKLKEFKMLVAGQECNVTKCIREDNRLIFTGILSVASHVPYYIEDVTLIDDRGFHFDRKPLSMSMSVMNGDTVNISYTLGAS